MNFNSAELAEQGALFKREFRERSPKFEKNFRDMEHNLLEEISRIEEKKAGGLPLIPEIDLLEIREKKIDEGRIEEIRKRGCVVVRNVFKSSIARGWFEKLEEYVLENGFFMQDAPGLDRYFSNLDSGRPQIYGIYWSKPQIEARQAPALADTRSFLNYLWRFKSNGSRYFDPDRECTYADRIRMREPGDTSLGLSPHIDAGSVERWINPG